MDIEALIGNLEAINDSLKSPTIRESDDFKKCVDRFQAKLADLVRVYNDGNSPSIEDTKTIILDLKDMLEEIDKLSSNKIKILDFVKDIVPKTS